MISKIIRILIGLLGAALGTTVYVFLVKYFPSVFVGVNDYKYIISIAVALIFGIFFYVIGPWII